MIAKPKMPILNKAHPLTKGLVACYPFYEGGGLTLNDISGNNNHAALINMDTTDWIKTPRGYGVDLDGINDYGNISNSTSLNPPVITVSAWFKAVEWTSTIWKLLVVHNFNGTTVPFYLGKAGTWNFTFGFLDIVGWHTPQGTLPSTGVWHLGMGTYNGTVLKIYVDNIETGTLDYTGSLPIYNTQPIQIGRQWDEQYSNVQIGEICIWNHALTAKKRTNYYTNPNIIYLPPRKLVFGKFILSPPTLSSPLNGATGVSVNPTLYWNASAGATSYRLQVSLNSGFALLVVDQSGITDTFYSVSLANNTTYWWRVNATGAGETSGWSTEWHFTTIAAPPPPEEASFPKILYNSILIGATLSATDTAAGFDVLNIKDYRPYTWWQATSVGTKYITIDCGVAKSADCLGIMGHNWGSTNAIISLESSANGVGYTEVIADFVPTSDKAIMKTFTSVSARYWRIKIIAASVAPKLAVAFLGVSLNFPYPPNTPYIPYTEKVEADVAQGKKGHLLGASLKFKSLDIDATFSNLERAWTINEFKLFWDNHGSKLLSFFYGWDLINYSDWVFYVNCEGMDFTLPMSVLQYIDSINLKMKGVSEF